MLGGLDLTAALRFQPTKRPQLAAQKQAQKIAQAKAAAITASLSASVQAQPTLTTSEAKETAQRPAAKTTIADWTGDGDEDEINGFYGGEKRQRGGRKKRKKNKSEAPATQNWDDIYDPSRPNNYEEYKHSEEKIREVREWKDRLYAHRMARQKDYSESDGEDYRPQMSSKNIEHILSYSTKASLDRFAPPSMSFAPPPVAGDRGPPPPTAEVPNDAMGEDADERRTRMSQHSYQPPPPPPAEVSNHATGDDAYARRLRMSQQPPVIEGQPVPPPPPPPPEIAPLPVATPPALTDNLPTTITRAPVRYNLPPPPPEIPTTEAELEAALREEDEQLEEPAEEAPRSLRPGQKGFAERLMSKYGWTKGTGLGANNSGIVNPLRVQIEKQKKKSDAEGGGFVGPGGRGKIIGGKKKGGGEEDQGKFGPMSEVIILKDMLDGMDLDFELGEGNLMQEIGEECGEKVSWSNDPDQAIL